MYILAGEPKYMNALQAIADGRSRTLEISIADIEAHSKKDVDLAAFIVDDCPRFEQFFYETAEELMPQPSSSSTACMILGFREILLYFSGVICCKGVSRVVVDAECFTGE